MDCVYRGGLEARARHWSRRASRNRKKAAKKNRPTDAKKVAGAVDGVQEVNHNIEAPILKARQRV